jgi:hypothetical protein
MLVALVAQDILAVVAVLMDRMELVVVAVLMDQMEPQHHLVKTLEQAEQVAELAMEVMVEQVEEIQLVEVEVVLDTREDTPPQYILKQHP